MHGTYLFTMLGSELADRTPDEIIGLFGSLYGDQDYLCNENNWWTPMYAVFQDGEMVQLADEDDWRGRNSAYDSLIAKTVEDKNPKQRFQDTIDLAWKIVHTDVIDGTKTFGLPVGEDHRKYIQMIEDTFMSMDYDSRVRHLMDSAWNQLIKAKEDSSNLSAYYIKKNADNYYRLSNYEFNNKHGYVFEGIFFGCAPADDWRIHNLIGESLNDHNKDDVFIIAVDIHT